MCPHIIVGCYIWTCKCRGTKAFIQPGTVTSFQWLFCSSFNSLAGCRSLWAGGIHSILSFLVLVTCFQLTKSMAHFSCFPYYTNKDRSNASAGQVKVSKKAEHDTENQYKPLKPSWIKFLLIIQLSDFFSYKLIKYPQTSSRKGQHSF